MYRYKTRITPLLMEGCAMNLNDVIVNVFCETDDVVVLPDIYL